MGYSLSRKRGAAALSYRLGYLSSDAWKARRRRYYGSVRSRGFVPMCQGCESLDSASLQLHHLSYKGVGRDSAGGWVAGERDDDLIVLCERCHEYVHKILDDFSKSYKGWSRRTASLRIIHRLREKYGLST